MMGLHSTDRTRGAQRAEDAQAWISIGEIARTFDVSLRTLRFYEDRGLLVPRREGTVRLYGPNEKARLNSILSLKHLGFTLTEIREIMADSDKRPASGGPRLRAEQVQAQLAHLEKQRRDIDGAISALRSVQDNLVSAA